jgi:hypothetical protein
LWAGVEIGNCALKLGFGGGRLIEIGRREFAVRLLFVAALGITPVVAVAIALVPIAPPAAAASASPPPVAVLFAVKFTVVLAILALRLTGQRIVACRNISFGVAGYVASGLVQRFVRGRLVIGRRFAVRTGIVASTASAASAASAAPPSARSAIALFVLALFAIVLGDLLFGRLAVRNRRLLEVVLFLDRDRDRLRLLGERPRSFRRVYLLAAVDNESLRCSDRLISRDGDGDGKALFQGPQVCAFLIEHVERHVGARAGDEIVRGAAHQLFFQRAQHLQRQR